MTIGEMVPQQSVKLKNQTNKTTKKTKNNDNKSKKKNKEQVSNVTRDDRKSSMVVFKLGGQGLIIMTMGLQANQSFL